MNDCVVQLTSEDIQSIAAYVALNLFVFFAVGTVFCLSLFKFIAALRDCFFPR